MNLVSQQNSKRKLISELKNTIKELKRLFLKMLNTTHPDPDLVTIAKKLFALKWVLNKLYEGNPEDVIQEEDLAKLYEEAEEIKK